MAELGSGNGTGYPGTLDTDNTRESSSTSARSDVPNDLAAAIVAIETELGTDPAGTLTDVKTFLQTEHDTDGTHSSGITLASATLTTATITASSLTLTGSGWPSVSADRNGSNQTGIATGTPTQVELNDDSTNGFDTGSDFNTSTYTFTPGFAGKYLIFFSASLTTGTAGKYLKAMIYKNGALDKTNYKFHHSTTAETSSVCGIFDANGTTDYFECYVEHNYGSDKVIDGTITKTFMTASRIA